MDDYDISRSLSDKELRAWTKQLIKERDSAREELTSKQGTIDMLWGQLRYHREKPAPRCPKCGSERICVHHNPSSKAWIECRKSLCGYEVHGFENIDAALDAWRGGAK